MTMSNPYRKLKDVTLENFNTVYQLTPLEIAAFSSVHQQLEKPEIEILQVEEALNQFDLKIKLCLNSVAPISFVFKNKKKTIRT